MNNDLRIDNYAAALQLIELLVEKGAINQATYANILKNTRSKRSRTGSKIS